jgi:hypothetical protein
LIFESALRGAFSFFRDRVWWWKTLPATRAILPGWFARFAFQSALTLLFQDKRVWHAFCFSIMSEPIRLSFHEENTGGV